MSTLIFDIETIGEDFDDLDESTQESLTRWIKREASSEEDYQEALQELKEGLGFSPLTGQIVAIGILDREKNKGAVYYQAPGASLEEQEQDGIKLKPLAEKEMLESFWRGCREYNTFVTFNGRAFDVPFLLTRSAIHGIRPSVDLMRGRYLYQQSPDAQHIDLLDQLSYYGAVRRKGNLHLWCRAFGITSPKAGGVTGDDVSALFRDKKFVDIAKYNIGDLRATLELYERWLKYLKC